MASSSGISGVQPKVLIRDEAVFTGGSGKKSDFSETFRGATHIVKFYDSGEYPHLATNEYFCLKAAEAAGLTVPPYHLAEDGSALVMERFDLRLDGSYRGFEDFCVLNGRRTDQKYSGSYETRVLRRFQQFANSPTVAEESLQLFRLIVFNCAIRNGDAHLKNFGVVYDDVHGAAHLAPAYDLVSTTAYIPKDRMALTLNGSTEWPNGKDLIEFAEGRSLASPRQLRAILQQTCDALSDTASLVKTSMKSTLTSNWLEAVSSLSGKKGLRQSVPRLELPRDGPSSPIGLSATNPLDEHNGPFRPNQFHLRLLVTRWSGALGNGRYLLETPRSLRTVLFFGIASAS